MSEPDSGNTDTPTLRWTVEHQAPHGLTLSQDSDGWDVAECDCGWISPPCPGRETAAEFWADHLEAPDGT